MWKRYINWSPLMHPLLGIEPAAQTCALTDNQTSDLMVHRPGLNPLSHTSQGWFYSFISGLSYSDNMLLTTRNEEVKILNPKPL